MSLLQDFLTSCHSSFPFPSLFSTLLFTTHPCPFTSVSSANLHSFVVSQLGLSVQQKTLNFFIPAAFSPGLMEIIVLKVQRKIGDWRGQREM